MMYLMGSATRRAPFSDWLAQVDRIAAKNGETVLHMRRNPFIVAMYECGLQPGEAYGSIGQRHAPRVRLLSKDERAQRVRRWS